MEEEEEEEVRERVEYDDRMSDLKNCMSAKDVVVEGMIVPLLGTSAKRIGSHPEHPGTS